MCEYKCKCSMLCQVNIKAKWLCDLGEQCLLEMRKFSIAIESASSCGDYSKVVNLMTLCKSSWMSCQVNAKVVLDLEAVPD